MLFRSELRNFARRLDASVAQILVANLIHAICTTGDQDKLKMHPVTISVPVNLRKHFPSQSVRNFSLYFNASYQHAGEAPDFSAILAKVKADFVRGLTKENLQSKLNHNMSFEKNFLVRITPLFLKKLIMKIGYAIIGHKPITSSVTNFGQIGLPETMQDWIDAIEFNLASGTKPGIAVVTYKGAVSIAFTSCFQDKALETAFYRFFTHQGLHVTIQSNYWQ